jgi:hypothetical protein
MGENRGRSTELTFCLRPYQCSTPIAEKMVAVVFVKILLPDNAIFIECTTGFLV